MDHHIYGKQTSRGSSVDCAMFSQSKFAMRQLKYCKPKINNVLNEGDKLMERLIY